MYSSLASAWAPGNAFLPAATRFLSNVSVTWLGWHTSYLTRFFYRNENATLAAHLGDITHPFTLFAALLERHDDIHVKAGFYRL